MAIKVFDRVIKNMEKFVFKKDVKITNNFVWEF